MPDELLRFVIGPAPLGSSWGWLAALLAAVLVGWYSVVFLSTRPRQTRLPRVLARAQAALVRRRFARVVRRIAERFDASELDAESASAALSRAVRDFLHAATGARAQYMQLGELAGSELAGAAPLLARINDVQFNAESKEDVATLSTATEELILSWT